MVKKAKSSLQDKAEISHNTREYVETLADLKKQIQEAQVKAALAANKELIKLYWSIGKTIAERQEVSGWGTGIVEQLAKDLQNAFPGIAGFSRRNIFRMKSFYLAYRKVPQAVAQIDDIPIFSIPWGHNALILDKVKDPIQRLWYAQKAIQHGWSRSMLELWIESNLYDREGKAASNFQKTLPSPQSDMAHQVLKDPYLFDFLTLHSDHVEKDLEQGLVNHIQKFLLELGEGFSFVGQQYHLQIADHDYYIDLLFYHLKLRCFFVVELKNTTFKPEYTGQINFYLSAVDDLLRHPDDKPTIGLLLCKTKDAVVAEYALRNIQSPVGVAEYTTKIVKKLPKELKSSLPTIEEIESELEKQKGIPRKNAKQKNK